MVQNLTEHVKLTQEQRDSLSSLLKKNGFVIFFPGHIHVAEPKPEHPVGYSALYKDYADAGNEYDLPVGFLSGDGVELVNTDEKFPEDYHSQLRQIFKQVLER